MKRLLVMLIGAAFCASAVAQTTPAATDAAAAKTDAAAAKAEARKAKQEMLKGTTEAATKQSSGGGYQGTTAPSKKGSKLTKEERGEAAQAISKQTSVQYGPAAAAQAAKIDPNAPKAVKPDMSDPKIREAMEKQKP